MDADTCSFFFVAFYNISYRSLSPYSVNSCVGSVRDSKLRRVIVTRVYLMEVVCKDCWMILCLCITENYCGNFLLYHGQMKVKLMSFYASSNIRVLSLTVLRIRQNAVIISGR
jgi:hypothetical protein